MKLLDNLLSNVNEIYHEKTCHIDQDRWDYIIELIESIPNAGTEAELISLGVKQEDVSKIYHILMDVIGCAIYDNVGKKKWDNEGWQRTCKLSNLTDGDCEALYKAYPGYELYELSYDQIIQVIGN